MKYKLVKAKVMGRCDGCCFLQENNLIKCCLRKTKLQSCMFPDSIHSVTYDLIYAIDGEATDKIKVL